MSAGRPLPGTPTPMHRWKGAGGLSIAGDAWGDPKGPLVLLQHGGGQTRHAWKGAGEHLGAAGYRAVAFDARGHGDSEWAADGNYTQDAMVEDLLCVVAAIGRPTPGAGRRVDGGRHQPDGGRRRPDRCHSSRAGRYRPPRGARRRQKDSRVHGAEAGRLRTLWKRSRMPSAAINRIASARPTWMGWRRTCVLMPTASTDGTGTQNSMPASATSTCANSAWKPAHAISRFRPCWFAAVFQTS